MKKYCAQALILLPSLAFWILPVEGFADFSSPDISRFQNVYVSASKPAAKKKPHLDDKKQKEEEARLEAEQNLKRQRELQALAEENLKKEMEENKRKAEAEAQARIKKELELKAQAEAQARIKRELELKAQERLRKEKEEKERLEQDRKQKGLDQVELLEKYSKENEQISKILSEEKAKKKFEQSLGNSSETLYKAKQKEALRANSRLDAMIKEIRKQQTNSALPSLNQDGAALFTYVNSSGLSDDEVYLQIVGVNPDTGCQCFIVFDDKGHPICYDVEKLIDSKEFSYAVSHFPSAENKGRSLYLPSLYGARLYTSIEQQLIFEVLQNEKGEWTINAPNPLNPNDPNREIIWDKTEFTVDSNAVFINPTAVDNFSLPLFCLELGQDGTAQSGGIKVSRNLVFELLQMEFQQAGIEWSGLVSKDPSLVYSPMYAAATGKFPIDLFVSSGWIDSFKKVYSKAPLLIDASESFPIDSGGGIWKGLIDPNTSIITFERIVDEMHPKVPVQKIKLPVLTNELIGGNGPGWEIETSNALQAAFARDVSCAIDTNTLSLTEALSQAYFKSKASNFYQSNPSMPQNLEFIDHYSKVLHSFGDHKVYTIPYDDELCQSGSCSFTPSRFKAGVIFLGPIN